MIMNKNFDWNNCEAHWLWTKKLPFLGGENFDQNTVLNQVHHTFAIQSKAGIGFVS